mmetsp:Transcript_36181/g.87532  ORF Transcript_36181/g.87532 Transcript_36181/m.87532 type:complete len:953 (+) Transcript_36181:89-2947(+)
MAESFSQAEQEQQPSVLDYLSFRASPPTSMSNRQRKQGVLWKRRDLFKYHWRPRWFVLHNEQHLLTYYLLANKDKKKNRRNSQNQDTQSQASQATSTRETGNRSRTASETSNISQNPVDYDVVPRGSIYLLGSSVEANQMLSKPSENLYVFTITDHEHATFVHLAARSVQVRDEWMEEIMVACNANPVTGSDASILNNSVVTNDNLSNSLIFTSPVRSRGQHPLTTTPTPFTTPSRINTTPPRSRRTAAAAVVNVLQSDFDRTVERLVLNHLPSSLTPAGMWMSEAHAISASTFEKMEQVLTVLDWNGSSSWKEKLVDAKERVDVLLSDSELESLEEILRQTKLKSPIKSPPPPVSTRIPNTNWSTLPADSLYDNTPSSMTQSMDRLLQRYLPYVDDVDHPDLQFKYDSKGVHCSVHKKELLIRSIRKVEGHKPSDYLQVLWVFKKDLEMESNVTKQEPLHQYNPHTSLVYKAYQAVWPTGPREFCSAAHWRLLKNTETGSFALCLLAFSCPEAEAMRPRVAPSHVRGYLNVSLHVWEQTPNGCTHTRILSYDLKGQIPKAIMQTVMTQQADLPRIMDAYVHKVKHRGNSITQVSEMTYESLYKVLKNQNKVSKKPKLKRSNSSSRSVVSSIADDDRSDVLSQANSDSGSIVDMSPTKETELRSRSAPPDVLLEGIVLLTPVVVHHFLKNSWAGTSILLRLIPLGSHLSSLIITLASIFFAIRWVIVEHLLHNSIQLSSEHEVFRLPGRNGKTQCHFTFNLRNMERYLKKKNDTKEKGGPETEVSHVVIRALALAMEHNPQSVARRVFPSFPFVYNPSVVLHDESASFPSDQPIWIPVEQQHSVDSVTGYLSDPKAEVEPNLLESQLLGPSCRLWVSPHHQQHNHPMVQVDWHAPDTPLSIVISSYLKRQTHVHTTNYLDVSMTFQSHDVAACRSFAKQFQQLIQIPDMCDE